MKIGVYGGSFNPVHKGHIKIANYVIDNNLVDKLLIVPSYNYWDKNNLISIDDRVNMLKFYEKDNIIVDSEFSHLIYTYQIIESLKEKYKNDDFCLIIGADNIVNFDKWKNYKKLLELELIIFARNGIDIIPYLKKMGKIDNYVIVEELGEIDISSTMIRNNIENTNFIKNYLDEEVLDYIVKKRLYWK